MGLPRGHRAHRHPTRRRVTRVRVDVSTVAQALDQAGLLLERSGDGNPALRGATQDSRDVSDDDLFLAWQGTTYDAHRFVASAVKAGAVAAVVERRLDDVEVPQLVVSDGRTAGAIAADVVYRSPWREAFMVGVTGTNGKTTTALLSRALLSSRGPTAAIGTLGLVEPSGEVRTGTENLTTPGPATLGSWLRSLVDEGTTGVALEVSSHALEQRRVEALRFDAAVFTNLSQDHLDYHGTIARYTDVKAHLADLLDSGGVLVVNADEPAWAEALPSGSRLTFATLAAADLRATGLVSDARGSRFQLETAEASASVDLPLIGRFNVENALGAAGAAMVAGLSLESIASGLCRAPQIPGRLERVAERPFTVLIDYAHTPDALDRVLATLRPIVDKRLIVVFGAGGDRDRSKRPRMAAAAARHADYVVVTSDNPRTEDPDAIIDEVLVGIGPVAYHREVDRRRAIAHALDLAREGDFVVLAGKGHERYQVLGTKRVPFDERAIVAAHLGSGELA
jgi:UDP-N-acetylmuramoyl-L-alanyl-D-glutamate--2,6-diaminopimelate ligase